MSLLEILFWLLVVLVTYTYVGYPLLLGLLAHLRPRPVKRGTNGPRSCSIVLCVRNEEANIDRRIAELTSLLESTGVPGEIIVVSDGSTDATATPVTLADGTQTTAILNLPAVVIIAALTTLLVLGTRESSRLNNIMVAVKLTVVVAFIVLGAVEILQRVTSTGEIASCRVPSTAPQE